MRMRDAAKRRLFGAERTAWGWRQQGRSLKEERRCNWNDSGAKADLLIREGARRSRRSRERGRRCLMNVSNQQQTKELVT
jgi:hypothetical protein